MRFSFQKLNVTPDFPVFQAGFADRYHESVGILDDVFARAVLIDANTQLLILAFDFVSGDRGFIDGLKSRLNKEFNFKPEEILINFSHTHSSISVGQDNTFVWSSTLPDRYYTELQEGIVRMVETCRETLEEGTLHMASGQTAIGVSRRLIADGEVQWAPNFQAEIDKELTVFKFLDKDECLKGILFSCGCHPSSLGPSNYLVSADFPGYACKYLEAHLPCCTPVFLQGCGGEIKPVASVTQDRKNFKDCTHQETKEAGVSLGMEVESLLEHSAYKTVSLNIRAALLDTALYTEVLEQAYFEDLVRQYQNDDPQSKQWVINCVNVIIDSLKNHTNRDSMPLYISLVLLDAETAIVGLEGEPLSLLGMGIKDQLKSAGICNPVVLGYTNGVQTYLPTRQALAEGGYERDVFLYEGLSGPFKPNTEDEIKKSVLEMLIRNR